MNKVILMGRLTREPDIRYSTSGDNQNQMAIARYTLAVERRYSKNSDQTADFIPCVTFGKLAEIAEKYFHQGTKLVVTGRIQTGNYTNKDGNKVYTTDVVVEDQEFAESKNSNSENNSGHTLAGRPNPANASADGFMSIPEGIEDDLPFK